MKPPEDTGFTARFAVAELQLEGCVESACTRQREWPDRVAAAVAAVLDLFAADPQFAEVFTVDALAAGEDGMRSMHGLIERLAVGLYRGRALLGDGEDPPQITEAVLLAGTAMLITERLGAAGPAALPAMAAEITSILLTPYLGAAAACATASRHAA